MNPRDFCYTGNCDPPPESPPQNVVPIQENQPSWSPPPLPTIQAAEHRAIQAGWAVLSAVMEFGNDVAPLDQLEASMFATGPQCNLAADILAAVSQGCRGWGEVMVRASASGSELVSDAKRAEIMTLIQDYPPPFSPANAATDIEVLKTYRRRRKLKAAADRLARLAEAGEDESLAVAEIQKLSEPSVARPSQIFRGFANFPNAIEEEEIVLGRGWERRGDIVTFIGNAGGGKSVAMTQASMAWSLGLPYMGIAPAKRLKIILFSGEDDRSTLGQIRDGFILYAKELTGQAVDMRIIGVLDHLIRVDFSREFVGPAFHAHLDKLLTEEPADLVVINPLLSYIGGDIVAEAPNWLRSGLMPILQKHNCAAMVAHHTAKMGKNGWDETDDIYSAIGGSEMANIPRSILTMRPTKVDGMMCVKVGKRTTTGWKDADGRHVTEWYMRRSHDPERPAWLPVPHAEALEAMDEESGNRGGGQKKKAVPVDVLKVIKDGPTTQSTVVDRICVACNCSAGPAMNAIKDAIKEKMAVAFHEKNPAGGIPIKWICLPEHAPKPKQ